MRFLAWLRTVPVAKQDDLRRRLILWILALVVVFAVALLPQLVAGDASHDAVFYAVRNASVWAVILGVWLTVRFHIQWRDQRCGEAEVSDEHTP